MAYNFNGTNQFLNTPAGVKIVNGMPLTMACWFYPVATTQFYSLMCITSDFVNFSNGGYILYALGTAAGDPVAVGTDPVGNTETKSTSGFSAATWSHACGVFTSSTSRTVYLNGENSATNTVSYTPSSASADLRLARFTNSFSVYLEGRIAEAAVWNAALTAAEVASLAKGMTCNLVRPQSLVFYSPLLRNLQDVKGGLTITNNNTATVTNHPRVYR
jgi:hypothetical protein